MQAWRRLIALIIIVLFAPNAVVAAGSLNLCLGIDGHRVVEPLFAAHNHPEHREPANSSGSAVQILTTKILKSDPRGCRDFIFHSSIQSGTRCASKFEKQSGGVDQSYLAISDAPPFVFRCCFGGLSVKHGTYQLLATDPRLVSLATVVLLN